MSLKKLIGILLVVVIVVGALVLLPAIAFVSAFPDFIPPKYEKESFDKLSNDILQQQRITEMDDLTRYTKKINGVFITLSKPGKADSFERVMYIDRLLDSLKIERQLIDNLRNQLEKTKLREFFKSNDSILFRADGIMGHSYGYFYTAKPMKPGKDSFYFAGHWLYLYESVNSNWKKTNITP